MLSMSVDGLTYVAFTEVWGHATLRLAGLSKHGHLE